MPDILEEFTLNHEPPNGGVPPGTMFAQAVLPTNPDPAPVDQGPPHGGAPPHVTPVSSQPPPYYPPPQCKSLQPESFLILLIIVTGAPVPGYAIFPAPLAMSPFHMSVPALVQGPGFAGTPGTGGHVQPANSSHNPPAEYLGEYAVIHFFYDGTRPCDFPCGYYPSQSRYSKHNVPCGMMVRDLTKRLGCPEGSQKGVTEMICVGNGRFVAGDTFTQGGEASKRTAKEVGWTGERGVGKEVWLVVKR